MVDRVISARAHGRPAGRRNARNTVGAGFSFAKFLTPDSELA